ncbi:hypothetical protein OF83DRAFT_134986 [Amylostereum chailletii]|nr:hypothetical protein OF83DRAFT_134986 [Amylostereum chailletii]
MQGLASYTACQPILTTLQTASTIPQQIVLPLPPPGAHAPDNQVDGRAGPLSQPHLASSLDSNTPTDQPLLPPFPTRPQVSHLPTPQRCVFSCPNCPYPPSKRIASVLRGQGVFRDASRGRPLCDGIILRTRPCDEMNLPCPPLYLPHLVPPLTHLCFSPSNLAPYVSGHSESPIQHGAQGSMFPTTHRSFESTRQMITPESSPLVNRGWVLPGAETTTTPTQLRRAAPPQTPPPAFHRHPSSPPSNVSQLSSPFMPKPSPVYLAAPPLPPSHHPSRAATPLHAVVSTPIDPDADAEGSDAEARPAGGEIERIREEQARARATLLEETESRRPEYLRRADRPFNATTELDPVWGIKESPAKGRRIELWGFTETSDESFEDRLMAGGYVGYGSTPGATMPTRPRTPSRAKEWANITTPGPAGSSKAASLKFEDDDEDVALDDRAVKKKRRLAAFRRVTGGANAVVQAAKATLQPVEVEGKGRVLLDLNEEEVPELVEGSVPQSPVGRKRGGKRKRRGGAATGGKSGRGGKGKARKEEAAENAMDLGASNLNWPDEQFPWSLRTQERMEVERMEETERMKSIAHFFDGDSDEDEEEEPPQQVQTTLVPMDLGEADFPEQPVYRGRGKMVPLRQRDLPDAPPHHLFFPSDPADARAALLSKRSVRALAARRRLREMNSDSDDETVCICHGTDDGRELVQCDDCKRWYHLSCIGLKFEDLGEEEDPWYCDLCEDDGLLDSNPSSEPTFVQGDEEDLTPRRMRDPLFFQSDLDASPAGALWRTPSSSTRAPMTPTRSGGTTTEFSTRSSWGSASRHGPTTPPSASQHVRVYSTPGAFETLFQGSSPFDPTTTPSRGIRFPPGVQKESTGAWAAARYGGPFATPTQAGFKHALQRYDRMSGGHFMGMSSASPNSYRSAAYDDTPVDRSVPRPVAAFPPRRQLESPLMGRGVSYRRPPPGPPQSPSLRAAKGKERVEV